MKTYGKIHLSKDRWLIDADPHVCLRLKRIFGKVAKDQGQAVLSDSTDNRRDLIWFLDRYPLEISKTDLSRLKSGAKQYKEKILTLEKILAGEYDRREAVMTMPPRDYQAQAAELWLRNGYLLLGDDLGVGKTLVAIYGLTDPRTRPALVCTLAHLTHQWRNEFAKFTPSIKTHILNSTTPYELKDKKTGLKPDILICNYHKLAGWADTLTGEIKSIVFDECQELRRGDSGKYSGAAQIAGKTKFSLGLSATPIYNAGDEMWNVVNVLRPDALGSRPEFEREWCGYKGRVNNPKAFGSFLRETGTMLRRTRADVKRELPPITHIPYEIDCDEKALDSVRGSAAALAKLILSEAPEHRGTQFSAAGKFDVIMRQATGISKAPYVADFVKMLIENGERVVLFGWHRAVYDIWIDKLSEFKPAMYTGEESVAKKEEAKRRFVDKETPLLIVSLRSGAGLDGLQYVCRTGVFGELDYSGGVHEQCCGRIFRDGQPDPVTMYYLNSTEGTDPIMIDILGIKKQQIEGIKNPYSDIIEKVDTTTDRIRKLAEHYLKRIGEQVELKVPEEEFEF